MEVLGIFRHVTKQIWMSRIKCHTCHAKRSYATVETSKSDLFCRTRHRHGNTALTRTLANGCRRLRTVAQRRANTPSTPRPREWHESPCYAFGNNGTGILFLFMDTIHPAVFPAGGFNTYFELITWNHSNKRMEPHISVSPYFLLVALWNLTVRYGHRPFSSMIFHTRWTRPNKISLLYQHIIPQHPQLKRSPSSPQAYHPSKIPLGGVKSWSPGVTEGRSLGLPAVGLGSAFHRLTRRGRRRTFGGHDISDIMILISSLYSYVIWYTMIIIIYIYIW